MELEELGEEMEQEVSPRVLRLSALAFGVDTLLTIQKARVASQVRETHLERQGQGDPDTIAIRNILQQSEEELRVLVTGRMAQHPAWPWLQQVKGCGPENTAKVVGLVEISRAETISALWSFAGYGVVNGLAPRRQKGEKLTYNAELRTMCWRVASSLLRAQGKFAEYYNREKAKYQQRFLAEGREIVPAANLPREKGKKVETAQFISEGHVHHMALRKMIKLWLACLWLVWRAAENLPTRAPYALEHGHSTLISPWEMVDR